MGFDRATTASHTVTTTPRSSPVFWPLFASCFLLSALSITNLALISSMVAWLLEQKHNVHTLQIDWPGNTTPLNVEPKDMWTDQGHESNGVAGYGFFLGIFGMMTAFRIRKAERPLKSLTALAVLLFLATLFTLSAIIFVFVVTYQTTGQHIREPVASNNIGVNYFEFQWTPETWFKAVLDLPLADGAKRDQIRDKVTNMVVWRWMLLPILLVDCVAFGITMMAWRKQRRGTTTRANSANSIEK
ncbi:hypothetical protein EJ02DRAFT_443207 [Clathrospora elynae]|uniref:Uncharacterized protein n=1 Tax=Clathrospora elynae TaxID=706981 RepID=A0A6A5ST77_9PLEO|nr:hypothetical protein EJ02DRAFT_443207 [Clathrospora elynae]